MSTTIAASASIARAVETTFTTGDQPALAAEVHHFQAAGDTILIHKTVSVSEFNLHCTKISPEFECQGQRSRSKSPGTKSAAFFRESSSESANLSLSWKTVYRSTAEYLSHKRMNFESFADNTFFAIPDSVQSPLTIASMVILAIALFLTTVHSIKVRAMSLVLFSARATAALTTHFNFFHTVPTPNRDRHNQLFGHRITSF